MPGEARAFLVALADERVGSSDLLEVRQLTPHRESPESGDSRSQ
jgi:hypothetical protein